MPFNIIRWNFSINLFEKNKLPTVVQSIENKTANDVFINTINDSMIKNSAVYFIHHIPTTFNISYERDNNFGFYNIKNINGFFADFSSYLDKGVEDYLLDSFGKKAASRMRKMVRRLETCFTITCNNYYGDNIKKEKYDILLQQFKSLIEKRFDQRGGVHVHLQRWEFYEKSVYKLIKEKKASLQVLYSDDTPIAIHLYYHYQNIINGAISSYDISYAKFGLGNIAVYKQVNWCLENNISMLDMGWGDSPYKRKWSNVIDQYTATIVYNKKNLTSRFVAMLLHNFIKLKNYLKSDLNIINKFKLKNKPTSADNEKMNIYKGIRTEEVTEWPNDEDLKRIDIYTYDNDLLKLKVHDFQFLSSEHKSNTKVYSHLKNKGKVYYVSAEQKKIKIEFPART